MPVSWFVQRVRRFVDAAIEELEEYELYDLTGLGSGLPNMAWSALVEVSREKLSKSVANKN